MQNPKPNYQLQAARDRKMWTLEEAAEEVEVDAQTFWRWENGVQRPRPYGLRKLCEVFGVSAEALGFGKPLDEDLDYVQPAEEADDAQYPAETFFEGLGQETVSSSPTTSEDPNSAAASDLFDVVIQAVSLLYLREQWSISEMHRRFDQALTKYHSREHEQGKISRRDALVLITSLSTLLGLELSGSTSPLLAEETVSLCATTIPACWSLVYSGGIGHVEKVLPTYLTHLTAIVHQSPHYRKFAANLASQGYKLANLLDLQREDFVAALKHSKEALTYGQVAEDPNLQVAALIEEALTFWYRKRMPQSLATYRAALPHLQHVSPIMQGRLYLGLAEGTARVAGLTKSEEKKQEALRYIGLAHDIFPDHAETDPNFAYTHYSRYYLYLYEGLMHVNLGQPSEALQAYARFDTPEYESRRTEITGREAAAALALGDLELCHDTVKRAVSLALSLDSDLRYSEAHDVYEGMLIKWPHEQKVKDLADLFQK